MSRERMLKCVNGGPEEGQSKPTLQVKRSVYSGQATGRASHDQPDRQEEAEWTGKPSATESKPTKAKRQNKIVYAHVASEISRPIYV
jgi:hypothetical protein